MGFEQQQQQKLGETKDRLARPNVPDRKAYRVLKPLLHVLCFWLERKKDPSEEKSHVLAVTDRQG